MEAGITDSDRATLVRAAVARVGTGRAEGGAGPDRRSVFQAPKAVANALNALRKHRDPAGVVTRPPYRAALPYVAAAVADDCLARTIEVLGDHSDDPTREQLLAALERSRDSFCAVTIAVMLAIGGRQPHAGLRSLLRDLATTDETYGLTGWATEVGRDARRRNRPSPGGVRPSSGRPGARRSSGTPRSGARSWRRPARPGSRSDGPERQSGRRRRSDRAPKATGTPARAAREHRPASDPAGRPHPGPGGGVRPRRPLGGRRGVRLGPVRPRRSGPAGARREVAAVRGRGGVVHRAAGSGGLLRRGDEEPRLEVRATRPLEAGRLRPADLDRERAAAGAPPTEGGPVGWLSPEDWNALW